jgi:hypothetical protein
VKCDANHHADACQLIPAWRAGLISIRSRGGKQLCG